MREFAVFFLSIFAVFIVVDKIYKRNQEISQVKSLIDDRTYIVRKLPDSQRAADKLAEINRKIINLIDSLKKEDREGIETLKDRYNNSNDINFPTQTDPIYFIENGTIDALPNSSQTVKYSELNYPTVKYSHTSISNKVLPFVQGASTRHLPAQECCPWPIVTPRISGLSG